MIYSLGDKVKVYSTREVGTITGMDQNRVYYIVTWDRPPYDILMNKQCEWNSYLVNPHLIEIYIP